MTKESKEKGDIAIYKAMSDLALKGFYIFTTISEHLPIDFIAYKDNKSYRIQSKYSTSGYIKSKTSWTDKNGSHSRQYKDDDFDYYALYNPIKDIVIYPSIKFKRKRIRFSSLGNNGPGYWYEDFLFFTDEAEKRIFRKKSPRQKKDKLVKVIQTVSISRQKVSRPSKEELEKLVWEIPSLQLAKRFKVSDRMIGKWCQSYQISKPPRGYWSSLNRF